MFAHAVLINGFAPFVLYIDVLIKLLASMPNSAILYSVQYMVSWFFMVKYGSELFISVFGNF